MYIIFDLGGVLIKFPGIKKLIKWMKVKTDEETFKEKWLLSGTVKKFETGEMDEFEFAENIIKEFKFQVSSERFLNELSNFREGPYRGADKLLKQLSKNHKLGILSNTNKLHWKVFEKKINFIKLIKYKFLSFQIGLIKPDERIYKYVIEKLGCGPDEIIYFDDNIINVEAAERTGIKSYKVNGFKELERTISTHFI